jgi:hypothetical protein
MKTDSFGWTQRSVGWWVAAYTLGLPADVRERRRAEIESDLWEEQCAFSREGRSYSSTAVLTLDRAVRGIPADLSWRVGKGDTFGQSLGLGFALSASLGMWLAFLRPGVPDLDSPAEALAAFYAGKVASIALGHGLMWVSAVLFMAFVVMLYRRAQTAEDCHYALPTILLASGLTAAAVLCLAFAFTGMASLYGEAGLDPSVTKRFFPLAGLTFHIALSGAIAVFLAATAAVSIGTRTLSSFTSRFGGILALLFMLEASGVFMVFMLSQALLLTWVVIASLEVPDLHPVKAP